MLSIIQIRSSFSINNVIYFKIMQRSTDGKNYFTFEYVLTSPNFSRAAFATIAIGNGKRSGPSPIALHHNFTGAILCIRIKTFCTGRHYTLIVGANERRWRKFRNKLKVVADSFQVLDIQNCSKAGNHTVWFHETGLSIYPLAIVYRTTLQRMFPVSHK